MPRKESKVESEERPSWKMFAIERNRKSYQWTMIWAACCKPLKRWWRGWGEDVCVKTEQQKKKGLREN